VEINFSFGDYMAAKTLDEFLEPFRQSELDNLNPRILCQMVWDAACKSVEEKFTSTNTGSPKLLGKLEGCVHDLIELPAGAVSSVVNRLNAVIAQLRAGA
jgi:hypothetical protein